MLRKPLFSLLMLSTGVTLLVAAALANGAVSATKAPTKLTVGTVNGIDYLDPGIAYDVGAWAVLKATEVTLVGYADNNASGGPLQLEGAAGWPAISANGLTYTWQIKPGFRFSPNVGSQVGGGTAVTAKSYERAFERLLSPHMYGGGTDGVFDLFDKTIVGGVAFHNGSTPHISGITATGDTLTITLTQATPYFTSAMAMIWFAAIPQGTPYDSDAQDNGATNFYPSAGPYYVTAANPNASPSVTLEKNPNYTGNRAQGTDKIAVVPFSTASACYTAVKGNAIDVDMCGLPSGTAAQAASAYGVHSVTGTSGSTAGSGGRFHVERTDCMDYLVFDTQKPPTDSIQVRRALEYIIDRKGLLSKLGPYAGELTDQILPPGFPGYSPFLTYPNTPDLATAALTAGSALQNTTLVIWHSQGAIQQQQASLIAQDLQAFSTATSANMTIENVQSGGDDLETYPTATQDGLSNAAFGHDAFNIAFADWCPDYVDPFADFNFLLDGSRIQGAVGTPQDGNTNLSYFNIPIVNTKLANAASLAGMAGTNAYESLDQFIMGSYAPVFPYAVFDAQIVTSSRVRNWTYDRYLAMPSLNALTVVG